MKYIKYTTIDDSCIPNDILEALKKVYRDKNIDKDEMIPCDSIPEKLSEWILEMPNTNEETEDEYLDELSYVED